jgi:hypothetical protein
MTDFKLTDDAHDDAERVIAAFLESVQQPTTKDWNELITRFPQHAADIVDAALIEQGGCSFEEGADAQSVQSGELFSNTVSKALNLAYTTPSKQLKEVQSKIEAFRGPAIRTLCSELQIAHSQLLSGVFTGTIRPPNRLLRWLAERLDAPVAALRETFSRSFSARTIPAFKSQDGKPSVPLEPVSWEEAVRSLHLTDAETKSLLAWDNQSI